MAREYKAIRNYVASMPWAIQQGKLEAMLEVLQLRASGQVFTADEIQARIGDGAKSNAMRASGSVAVLPLYGVVSQKMNLMAEISGGTSTELFGASFRAAVNDTSVSAIVIDIDSPGGCVSGVPELAKEIMAARGTKPIIAVSNPLCASAAYWIGSAADELYVTESGEAGSIGVYMVHFDHSRAMDADGVTPTIIKAGKYKAEGNPYEPLDDEAIRAQQQQVDDYYDLFATAVARQRGVSVEAVVNGFGEGRCVTARRAVKLGIADGVATLDEVLESLGASSADYTTARVQDERRARKTETLKGGAFVLKNTKVKSKKVEEDDLEEENPNAELDEENEEEESAEDESPDENEEEQALEGDPEEEPEEEANDEDDEPEEYAGDDDEDEEDEEPAPSSKRKALRPSQIAARHAAKYGRGITARGGAVRTVLPSAQTNQFNRPVKAKEHSVKTRNTAAQNGAASDNEVLVAERKRVHEINVLCKENGIDDATRDKYIQDGLSVTKASHEILKAKREGQANKTIVTGVVDREAEKPWASLGDQLMAIKNAGMPGGTIDKRLYAAASGGSAGVGADGGFLIHSDFSVDLTNNGFEVGILSSRCRRLPIGENSDRAEVATIDETSRATGSRWGGVRVYRRAEAATVASSNPKIGSWECKLEDMMGLAYMTETQLQDASQMESVYEQAFTEELAFQLDDEIFRGTGVGQCLGILSADCTVSVAKEAGQAADTIVAENIMKMWSRVLPRSRYNGAWFINVECEPQLQQMMIGTGTSGQLVYMPPGGLSGSPYGSLYGRPVIPIEHASALGDVGDISFGDYSQYVLVDKGGVRKETSIHVRFIYDERAFKWVTRVNGKPKAKSAITPYKGSNTLSSFVTLAAR